VNGPLAALRQANESDRDWASLDATFDRAANAPGAYQRTFNNVFGEAPLSEGALRALKALDKRPEDVARVPSPLPSHVRDKFKKAKPTAVPRIPLDQRLVDPSSLATEESSDTAPSSKETAKPDSSDEDAVMQGEGNQETVSAPKDPAKESSAQSTGS
jgi:hypothetical protein